MFAPALACLLVLMHEVGHGALQGRAIDRACVGPSLTTPHQLEHTVQLPRTLLTPPALPLGTER
ncbi:MAG: hypothetical protein JWO02_2771 [Solirubrobacterales bacterium]|nr:hypothetical protein [Solirubrobacterales bacterium]